MNKIGENIRQKREELNISQEKLSDLVGISPKTLQRIEKGESDIKVGLLKKIAKALKTDFYELIGTEPINIQTNKVKHAQNVGMNIKNYNNNSIVGTKQKDFQIQSQQPQTLVNEDNNDNFIKIPYYPEIFAAAGAGAYNYEEASKSITFTKVFLEDLLELTIFQGLHIINAIGDSMSPTIESGDKLFVLPFEVENCKAREGGIYVISCNFGVLVKRIYFNPFTKELILKSDNKEIPDITITGDELDGCQIIGRVVGSIKKF